jgi:hypothetical protein
LQILLRKTLYSLFGSDRGLLDLQFSYSKFGQLTFKILEIIEFKQGASNTIGQGRNRATTSCVSAQRTPPNAGCPRRPHPLAPQRSPPPEADRIPRLRTCRGRLRPTTRWGPRRATRRRAARAMPAGHAPLRTGGPSASSHPRAPCYGRDSRCRHLQAGLALFKHRISPSARHPRCRPPLPPRRWACSSARSRRRPTVPLSPLGPIEPPQVMYCHTCASPRRNPEPPRLPPPATAEPPHRRLLRPNQDRQPTLGAQALDPELFPGRERRRSHRISGEPAVPWAEGPNCTV